MDKFKNKDQLKNEDEFEGERDLRSMDEISDERYQQFYKDNPPPKKDMVKSKIEMYKSILDPDDSDYHSCWRDEVYREPQYRVSVE